MCSRKIVWELVSMEKYKELAEYLSEKVNRLAVSGAEIIALTAATMHIVFEEIENVARRIYEELEVGIVKESTLQEFNQIIEKMQKRYEIEAVILGCTELPLILNNENSVLPCLDSVEIHIKELIKLAQRG